MENFTLELYSLNLEYVHSRFISSMDTRQATINVDKGSRSSSATSDVHKGSRGGWRGGAQLLKNAR